MKWAESGRPQCVNGRWLMPGRDINHVSTPDNFVPAGFRGRHAKTGSLLERLRRVIPAGIEPKFSSAEELMAWHREEGARRAAEVDKINQQARAEKIFGRSGIQNLHRGCTFANYEVITAGQKHALTMAKAMPKTSALVSQVLSLAEVLVPGKTISLRQSGIVC